jgi:diguanylate cyclase (GGDEF)-like protein/PAS domain S-box-containing protein
MLAAGVISEIALVFVTNEDFDTQVDKTLAIIGSSLGVSRCCLFMDSADGMTARRTREWCAGGVKPQADDGEGMLCSEYPFWTALQNEAVYAVDDVGSLPVEIRRVLEAQGIRSVVMTPLRVEGLARGFLAFSECARPREWNTDEIETLKTISGIIASACSKQLLAERLSASEENFRNLFHTVDEIIVVVDPEGRIVFANEGAIRKLGHPPEEYLGKSVLEFLPSDERAEGERIVAATLRRELTDYSLDVVAKDGTRIPVEIRVWSGSWDGQNCFFVLGKDVSAEQAARLRFERLFRGNPAAMAIHAVDDGRCVDANDAYLEVLGYSRDQVVGKPGRELELFADDLECWLLAKEELLGTGAIRNCRLKARHKDGKVVHGLLSGETLDIQGQLHVLTVMLDVTEEVELQSALTAERNRLANVIRGTRLGSWEWNLQTGETTYNERWAEILGYTLAELEPTSVDTWVRLSHPDDVVESDRLLKEHFEGNTDFYEFEGRMLHKNGDWVWILDRGRVVDRDTEGRPRLMYGTHTDITERKAMEEQIRELAIRDPLTGIYNRRYLFERLGGIVAEYSRYGRNFCVSILDIDNFKAVNDAHGHQAGDFALQEFAHIIASTIRQYDLLGRYGGEEFIIVSTSVGWPEIAVLIERVMGMVRGKAFVYEEREIRFTFSCGIADSSEFPRDECSIEAMLARADKRLYAAKAAGRDRLVGPQVDLTQPAPS